MNEVAEDCAAAYVVSNGKLIRVYRHRVERDACVSDSLTNGPVECAFAFTNMAAITLDNGTHCLHCCSAEDHGIRARENPYNSVWLERKRG